MEEQYKGLTRDYQSAQMFYTDLLGKQKQSEMATDLERKQQGETFRVMDSPNLPERPAYPNRQMMAGAGFGGGVAVGFLIALLLEMRDKSIRSERDVEFWLELPTLGTLPSVAPAKSRRWGRKTKSGAAPPAPVLVEQQKAAGA